MSGKVYPLAGSQRDAVDPRDSVWLSASAGTGKTQVLSARVLRLLLEDGVDPGSILCLTFTKAGAAEMSVRVGEVLARWVRMPDAELAKELSHVGAPVTPEVRKRARSLFARVLDCPGGGLRIDTIHAFAQWLLAAFPGEAQMLPGTRAMEDRERALLLDEVLTDLIARATSSERAAIEELSRRKGPDGVRTWLMRCASAMPLWEGPGGWQPPMRPRVCHLLGLPSDADEAGLAILCEDHAFDVALRDCLVGYRDWKSKTADLAVAAIGSWLAEPPTQRLKTLDSLADALFFKNGNSKLPKNASDSFIGASACVGEALGRIQETRQLIELADFLAPQLETGRSFALLWAEAKAREGLVDFDDLISKAANLLSDKAMSDWIRYKLDRQFDHILIDEAQDTNEAQWRIIDALTDDFFAGEGAHGSDIRTIFTVGDTKQAIFGFQGTSPRNFIAARDRVAARMEGLSEAAAMDRGALSSRALRQLDLDRSFRTADAVLQFVDRSIEAIGPAQFGLDRVPPPHVGEDRPGLVALWDLVIDGEGDAEEPGGEQWLARHDRQMADKIARQISAWMRDGFPLVKGEPSGSSRRATPGDVMVLVRKRRELASLIVARLYSHGVPVAGVDRLRLGAPLAVKDLMAAIRFAVQPLDDLTLASLLVSPLGGWTQEDLLRLGYRPKNVRLWHHLRQSDDPQAAATVAMLREILRRADFDSPQALLHFILTGPMDGRRRLVARLGREANDPIDEVLNAASAYAAGHVVSLQGFIRWFDAGEGDLKRDAGEARDEVRVMTVHGSKGLQAPIVILADAAIGPDEPGDLALAEKNLGAGSPRNVPIPGLPKDQRSGPIAAAYDAAKAEDMQEHWRLLYVAMTRAEEALFIGGSLGPRDAKRGVAHEDSWYARLLPLFDREEVEDELWGSRREWGQLSKIAPPELSDRSTGEGASVPPFLDRMAPEEPRPPRPLAPSGSTERDNNETPMPPELSGRAARRGVLVHSLLERLPTIDLSLRAERGARWLDRQAPDLAEHERSAILDHVLAVLEHSGFADVFSPQGLAEVPLAATVAGQVITGTVDRLLVTDTEIVVIDFKTTRDPPSNASELPPATLRQMSAYAAALEAIFPGRAIKAAVLYTQTPVLLALPDEMLASGMARLRQTGDSFASPPVD